MDTPDVFEVLAKVTIAWAGILGLISGWRLGRWRQWQIEDGGVAVAMIACMLPASLLLVWHSATQSMLLMPFIHILLGSWMGWLLAPLIPNIESRRLPVTYLSTKRLWGVFLGFMLVSIPWIIILLLRPGLFRIDNGG